jgi:hypothetical protein
MPSRLVSGLPRAALLGRDLAELAPPKTRTCSSPRAVRWAMQPRAAAWPR